MSQNKEKNMKNQLHTVLSGVLLLLMSMYSYALSDRELQEKENMKMLAAMGLPLPGSGIHVVPRASLDLSEEALKKGAEEEEQMKTRGYIPSYTEYPKELLNFHLKVKEIKEGELLPDTSTKLRRTVAEIKLGFKPKGFDNALVNAFSGDITLIAAVPQGGFHDEKGGWSGVAQFFMEKHIGTCSYGVMNVKVSQTAAQLAEESITYDVNNKPTLSRIEGSEHSGFLYTLEWYDNENFHELECANMKYSKELTDQVLNLAKIIDNSN